MNYIEHFKKIFKENDLVEMNKGFSLLGRHIPYIPKLRETLGSLESCLLFQQFEYWFARHPKGFYKFIEPCQHEKYVVGDSWMEELKFTKHEVRKALESICIRYPSLSKLDEILKAQQNSNQHLDPFQNHFYCSVKDPRSNITLYFRNHQKLNTYIHHVLKNHGVPEKGFHGLENAFSNKSDVLNSKLFTSGDLNSIFPIDKETKNNNKDEAAADHTTFTDSISSISESEISESSKLEEEKASARTPIVRKPIAAVLSPSFAEKNSSLKPEAGLGYSSTQGSLATNDPASHLGEKTSVLEDGFIGKALTMAQGLRVRQLAKEVQSRFTTYKGNDRLFEELCYEILDDSFSQCGKDFYKKLNVLRKAILAGQWTQSRRRLKQKEQRETEKSQALQSLQARLREVELDINSLKHSMTRYQELRPDMTRSFLPELKRYEAERERLLREIEILSSQGNRHV